MFGFMMITAMLSMFINNIAATAMILPIAIAVLDEMEATERKRSVVVAQDDDTTPACAYIYSSCISYRWLIADNVVALPSVCTFDKYLKSVDKLLSLLFYFRFSRAFVRGIL